MENIQVKIFKRNEIDELLRMQTYQNSYEKQQATPLEEEEQEMSNNYLETMEENQNENMQKNQKVQLYLNPYQRRAHHRSETMLTQHVNFTMQEEIQVKSRRPPSQLKHILNHPSKSIRDMYANLYTRTATSCASSRSQDNKYSQIKQVISPQSLKNQSINHNNQLHLNGKFQPKNELTTAQLSNTKPSFIMQLLSSKPSTPSKYPNGFDSMKNRFRVFSEYSSHHSTSNPKITFLQSPNIYSATQSCINSQPSTPIAISSKANIYFKNNLQNSNTAIMNQKMRSEERQYMEQYEMEEQEEKQLQNYILKGSLERLQGKINEQRNYQENSINGEEITENYDMAFSSQQQFDYSKSSILKKIMNGSQIEQGDNRQNDNIQAGPTNLVQIRIINGSGITPLSKKSTFTHFTVGKLQNISSGYSANKQTTKIVEELDVNANENNNYSPTFSNKEQKSASTFEAGEQVSNKDDGEYDKTPKDIKDQVPLFSLRKISCYSDKYKGQRDLLMKNFLEHNTKKISVGNGQQFLNSNKEPSNQPISFLKRHFSVSGDVQIARKVSQQSQPTAGVKQTVETESDIDGYSSSQQLKQVFIGNKATLLNNIEKCGSTSNQTSTKSNKSNGQFTMKSNLKSPKPNSGIAGFYTKSSWENNNNNNQETINPQKNTLKTDVNPQQQNIFQQFNPEWWDGCVPSSPWEVNTEKGLIELTDSQAEQIKKNIKKQEINLNKRNTLEKVFGATNLEKEKNLKVQILIAENATYTGKIVSERSNSQGNHFAKTKQNEQLEVENIRRVSSSQNFRSARNVNSQNQMSGNVNFPRKGYQVQSRQLFTNTQKDIKEQPYSQKQQQLQEQKSSQSTPIQHTKTVPQSQISLQQGLIRKQAQNQQQFNALKYQQQQIFQSKQQRNNNLINQIEIGKQLSSQGEG